jgi:hypothetical protein
MEVNIRRQMTMHVEETQNGTAINGVQNSVPQWGEGVWRKLEKDTAVWSTLISEILTLRILRLSYNYIHCRFITFHVNDINTSGGTR